MFWNIYSKRVIGTLRDREMIVWTWAFPILLSTLFFFTFTSLDTVSQLQVILLGVVDNTAYREDVAFSAALGAVSEQNDSQLFELTRLDSVEQGDALLQEGAIDAYLFVEDVPRLVVTSDGMSQTIAKGFLDRYLQTKSAVETLLRESPEAAERLPLLMGADSLTREISLTDAVPTDKVNYFYALLAMVCMYGGFQGIHSISYLQANLSPLGARRTMAPVGRFRLITADLLGGITVHFLLFVRTDGDRYQLHGCPTGPDPGLSQSRRTHHRRLLLSVLLRLLRSIFISHCRTSGYDRRHARNHLALCQEAAL